MQNLINTHPRSLGKEMQIGPLGYGCWRLVAMSVSDAQARIEAALAAGMNLIDTADVYGLDWGGSAFGQAEELLGEVLRTAPHLRSQMVLASKGGIIPGVPYDSANLVQACEASLQRLNVEQLDLYQIHRPDMLTHPAETAALLEQLRKSGKVREFGVSNHTPAQVAALVKHLDFPLVSHQPEYSALALAPLFDGVFDQCMALGLTVLAWSPLAGGRLATTSALNEPLAEVLQQISQREDVDIATLALAFCMAHPSNPVAIVGSTTPARISNAGKALGVTLTRKDVYDIIQASRGESLP
ncbi:MAG: aldo/keto reductase family oxidoreductase [bacterium]